MKSNGRIAAIITNYNMPERTDALAEYLQQHTCCNYDLYVVDNGSDLVEPAASTTHRLGSNRQTTGGWLYGLEMARRAGGYTAYAFIITSAEIVSGDPLGACLQMLQEDPQAVGVHPTLTTDSTTHWTHMLHRGGVLPRRTWFIDNIFSVYNTDWFDAIGGFDPALIYAWGIDLETCWLARKAGRALWLHEGVQVRKVSDIGYAMGRMNMPANTRQVLATANMQKVLSAKYGEQWHDRLLKEYIKRGWE